MARQRASVQGLGKELFDTSLTDVHPVDVFTDESVAGKIINIPIEAIEPNPEQPRKHFDEEALRELSESIRTRGVLQPIIVKKRGDTFLLVAGERRYRASKLAGLTKLPCVVNTDDPLEIAIIENLQREDLRPIEEAEGLKSLATKYKYSHERLAATVGKSRSSVTEILSLTKLPKVIREACRTSDKWSKSVLLEIGRLEDEAAMLAAWEKLNENGATVKAARAIKLKRPAETNHFRHVYHDPKERFTVTVRFEKDSANSREISKALESALLELSGRKRG